MIKALHSFLSLVSLSNVYSFTIPLCSCSTIHFHNLVRITICFVFHSLYPMSVRFFKARFFITCPRNFKWFSLILSVSTFYVDFSLQLRFDPMPLSIVFSASFCVTRSLLPQAFSSFVKKLFNVFCHMEGVILHSSADFNSKEFYSFFLNSLLAFLEGTICYSSVCSGISLLTNVMYCFVTVFQIYFQSQYGMPKKSLKNIFFSFYALINVFISIFLISQS